MADGDDKVVPLERLTGGRQRRERPSRRAYTESVVRLSKTALRRGAAEYPDQGEQRERPWLRAECVDAPRPCPWVGCRHHLAIDVNAKNGAIKYNFPDIEVEAMRESCTLDVAARGGVSLEDVGEIMNLTRERVRQVEDDALAKIARHAPLHRLTREALR